MGTVTGRDDTNTTEGCNLRVATAGQGNKANTGTIGIDAQDRAGMPTVKGPTRKHGLPAADLGSIPSVSTILNPERKQR